MKKIIALIVMFAVAFSLIGCFPQTTVKFNIDFIVDGEVYDTVKTDKSSIEMPTDPTKEDYEFKGWFWDKDVWDKPLTLNSLLDAPISETWRVYAKFIKNDEQSPVETEWTNDNAVYATVGVRTEFIDINEFAKNIETIFDTLDFKTIYVVEKIEQIPWVSSILGHLKLLFVLNEGGRDKQDEFIELLRTYYGDIDESWGITDAWVCWDVPYVDNRSLDALTDTINIDETLTITFNGNMWSYLPPFDFDSVYVTLSNYDTEKTYTLADFPNAGFASVTKWEGYRVSFIFELAEPNYFNIIKAIDILSRFLDATSVELSYICYDPLPSPIWEISDRTIVDFIDYDHDHPDVEGYYCGYCNGVERTIQGLKLGTATVNFNGVYFNVTVTDGIKEYLNPEIKREIQQSYIDTYLTYISRIIEPDEVRVDYYGTYTTRYDYGCDGGVVYRESIAVMISFNYGMNAAVRTETVAGYEFFYPGMGGQFEFFISIWNEGVFYTLTDAYVQGLLTTFNIRLIHAFHKGLDINKYEYISSCYQKTNGGERFYFDKYLGRHNGYEAFFIAGENEAIWDIEVAGYNFGASTYSSILVCKEQGKVYDFVNAYNGGLLSKQDIANIWYYYQNGIGNPIYFDKYLGTYNGYDILFVEGCCDEIFNFEIAGKTFYYLYASQFIAYKNGLLYDLSYAYNQGFLSAQDIAEIWSNYAGD